MIPDGWKRKSLGEIADISSGSTPLRQKDEYWNEGTIPWVTTGEIDYQIIESAKEKITELALKECSLKIYDRGTILMAMYGQGITRGRIALLGINAATNQACCAINVDSIADTKFVYFQLEHLYQEIRKLGHGGNQQNLNGQIIKQIPIMFPPLLEQCRIAEVLGVWDESIDLLEKLIGRVRSRKQWLMQQLLTGKKRFKEFEGSEWKRLTINDVCEVKGGKRLPKGENLVSENTGYPYIRVTDMYMGGIDTSNIMYVPSTIAPLISNYTISQHDIFISVAGTLGIVGEVPLELNSANLTENADKMTSIKVNKKFLLYYLQSSLIQKEIDTIQTQNAQPKLALTRIRKFPILVPSSKEQEKIATVLSAADEEISTLEKQLAAYKQQKLGLMQQLLTGRIRI